MPDGERGRASHEPGHRYVPRQVTSRFFDVAQRSNISPKDQTNDVKSAPVPVEVTPIRPTNTAPAPVPSQVPVVTVSPRVAHKQTGTDARAVPKQSKERPVSQAKPASPRQHRSLVLRRQIVDKAYHYSQQHRAQRQRAFAAFAFGGLAATVILVGGFGLYLRNHSDPQVLSDQTSRAVQTESSNSPTEELISQSQIDAYQTPAKDPRILRIAKLGIQARIYPVVADYGGIPLPARNIHDVGWLSNSSRPGQAGVTLINGSVAGLSKSGVFSTLSNLAIGDRIQVELGDGTVISYKVSGSRTLESDSVDMGVVLRSSIPGKEALNLLTDQGRFIVKSNKYESRTLITAVIE